MQQRDDRAVSAALCGAVCFGVGNIAYRYGEGGALAIAGQRCLVGVALMTPIIIRTFTWAQVNSAFRNAHVRFAVIMSALQLVSTAVMMRTLTSPQAALLIAVIPLFIITIRRFFVQHRSIPVLPVAICVIAATTATVTGGLGAITPTRCLIIVVFLLGNSLDILATERARTEISSSFLVGMSMIGGATLGYASALLVQPGESLSTSGLLAATVVGLAGTTGRWLRSYALPRIGSVVVASTSQVSALCTLTGGIVLLHDRVRPFALALALIAAASAFWAVVQSGREPTTH